MLLARLIATVALAALPVGWVVRHRGTRRDRAGEGKVDGILMLGALVLAAFALVLAVVAVVRERREAQVAAGWRPITARLERCAVAERRGGGRGGARAYELACTARVTVAGQPTVRTVSAGFPPRRAAYDAWVAAHPPGSAIRLWQDPRDPTALVGLAQLASGTTTAAAASTRALTFAVVSAALFGTARLVARRRAA